MCTHLEQPLLFHIENYVVADHLHVILKGAAANIIKTYFSASQTHQSHQFKRCFLHNIKAKISLALILALLLLLNINKHFCHKIYKLKG